MDSAPRRSDLRLIVAAALVVAACAGAPHGERLRVADRERSYEVHLPATPPSGRYPLVIVLHGGGGTASGFRRETRFDELADREGFAVVYPQGLDRHWNDGRADGGRPSDVAFIGALIDALVAAHPIDPDRVFVTGISNGGMMSYRLACELADKIAAAAPVAAQVPVALAPRCAPARAVSLLAINGTADPQVPWRGGRVMHVGQLSGGEILATPKSVEVFVLANRCATRPITTWEPDRDPRDGTTVQHVRFPSCADGAAVELLNINGGGHTWPGGDQYLDKALIGPVSREFSATNRIWRFFVAHGRAAR